MYVVFCTTLRSLTAWPLNPIQSATCHVTVGWYPWDSWRGTKKIWNCHLACSVLELAMVLGPLHDTRAKSRDHETVWAQKKLSIQRPSPRSCSVVMAICDRALKHNAISNEKYIYAGPHTWLYHNESMVVSVSGVPWLLCLPYLQEVGFEKNNLNDHETWSIWCHGGIRVNFIH